MKHFMKMNDDEKYAVIKVVCDNNNAVAVTSGMHIHMHTRAHITRAQ